MIFALLLGLAAAGPPAPVEHRGQTVFVRWDATTKACVPQVNGVETGDIETQEGRAAFIAALPDKGAAIRLSGTAGMPYGCTADIVTALRHAGFYGPIGFNPEPAPIPSR